MSTLKVGGIRGVSASSDAITVANDGSCTANVTNRQNRNLIINGAMNVAQRGTSSTTGGYTTVDRVKYAHYGTNEAPTYEQVDVASGTPAYQAGFRKAFKITNGNQTATDAGDHIQVDYFIEAQDLANSGWDYTSSSSYVTLSFWIKSSTATAFPATIRTNDGTNQAYNMSTGTLTADTWTKVTKTIPGNANVQIDNNNEAGIRLMFSPYFGTTWTTSGLAMDTWSAWTNAKHSFEMATNWWTTDNATWEITGLQLEVGSVATDFEHRSYGQELVLCQRYYEELHPRLLVLARYSHHDGNPYAQYHFKVEKRAAPTCTSSGTFQTSTGYSGSPSFSDTLKDSTDIYGANSVTAGGILYLHNNSNGICHFSAEL